MAKINPLQEQLIKAGLAKKSKAAAVAREQNKARDAKGPTGPSEIQLEAERMRVEKVERDRALAAEGKAKARITELRAQARQIIKDRKVPRTGESEYRFTADGAIRSLLVNEDLRKKLSSGALVIARMDQSYELLPRAAAEKVRERDASLIVLDHGQDANSEPSATSSEDDAYYAQFKVPDDLVW
ncbi:MAG: nucleoprotein/polynucleotide-associated enzyme [Gammaproteobacteria bacterium RIFCSPHIGHO2_12_FULL_63_22]|nr:MAG: nucleoprotein/polynucleotide-associated enzyme [Gammaproteobacteria bacterium RIFCSPHIGHO2_12_FULL_63_22]